MSLRPLLEIVNESERLAALRETVRSSDRGPVDAYVSAAMRPYMLAALIGGEDGEAGGPVLVVSADDRSARDLAGDLKAFLAPRPVHIYPSLGTTFESHLDPPPHLAGLRIAAMNAMSDPSAVVVASAIALAEKVPDPALRPETLALHRGESVDLDDVTLLRSEEHTSELQSHSDLVCRLLLEKKNTASASIRLRRSSATSWRPGSAATLNSSPFARLASWTCSARALFFF